MKTENADPLLVTHKFGHILRYVRRARHRAGDTVTGRRPWGGYLVVAISFPSGETAHQVPPTPWPLVSPGLLSPA